jgi:hypothetical protein
MRRPAWAVGSWWKAASGFLLKDTPPADIVRAVRAVAAGEPMLSPTITRRLIGHVTDSEGGERRRHAREQLERLTDREREVAVAVGQGKSNPEISREPYGLYATKRGERPRNLAVWEVCHVTPQCSSSRRR